MVLDPGLEVYQACAVDSSWLGMVHPRSLAAAATSVRQGLGDLTPTRIDGPMATMPANFLVDAETRIVQIHRARTLDEGWTVDEALAAAGAAIQHAS